MACGLALKRPYEYDEYLSADGSSDAKRARTTHAHCSPFRAQIGTIAASLPVTSGTSALLQLRDAKEREEQDTSPFSSIAGRTQLSSEQLKSYLRAEVRYLKRRRLIPHRKQSQDSGSDLGNGEEGPLQKRTAVPDVMTMSSAVASYRAAPSSPTTNSGSDSEGEGSTHPSSATNGQKALTQTNLYDKPQFSLKQVQMICERLLKQQEVRLRYEYETVLNQRLEEQHEQYVQFAREHIDRQHQESAAELSYLS